MEILFIVIISANLIVHLYSWWEIKCLKKDNNELSRQLEERNSLGIGA